MTHGPLWEYFERKRAEYKKIASEESRASDYHYWKGKEDAYKQARDYVARYHKEF